MDLQSPRLQNLTTPKMKYSPTCTYGNTMKWMGKRVYGHTQLEDLLKLELDHNSLGGFDKYLSNFKDMFKKLEECGQGLFDYQQHSFSYMELSMKTSLA